jgi:endonuclease/exonuclease/phosphatase family metal-dependent hydrolase
MPQFSSNDNLSVSFDACDLVPDKYKGDDHCLDVVAWNIKYFNQKDPSRVQAITEILSAINADVFVFEEAMDGSLDSVANDLTAKKAGLYETRYGKTGGNQRVAIMYDTEWVRAKDDIVELFGKGTYKTREGKDVFPRLPLHGQFVCSNPLLPRGEPFDFQLVGLHLKSQRGGGADQRQLAGKHLSKWLLTAAQSIDADVIMLGDWNAPPTSDDWREFVRLEDQRRVAFRNVNDASDFSHLMYKSKNDFASRLDLAAISIASISQMIGKQVDTIRWKSLDEFLKKNPEAGQIKSFIQQVSAKISDHMPIIARFYFTRRN